jgi:hypothetical protein
MEDAERERIWGLVAEHRETFDILMMIFMDGFMSGSGTTLASLKALDFDGETSRAMATGLSVKCFEDPLFREMVEETILRRVRKGDDADYQKTLKIFLGEEEDD